MKRTKTLLTIFVLIILGILSSTIVEASSKYIFALTGKVKVINKPGKNPIYTYNKTYDYSPVFKKNQDGTYTLTMYENTYVALNIKKTKNTNVYCDYKSSFFDIWCNDNNVRISSFYLEENSKQYKKTVTLKLGKANKTDSNYSYLGESIKLTIIVKQIPKIEDELLLLLRSCGYSDNMSDFDKFLLIYDWIAENVDYDYSYKNSSAIDALIKGKVVCSGYSYLVRTMCDAVGLESRTVTSWEMDHMWNKVKIDNKWYYVDSTWHDWRYTYFLKGYDFFAENHKEISNDLKLSKSEGLNISKENYVWPEYALKQKYKEYIEKWTETEKKEYDERQKTNSLERDEWWEHWGFMTEEDALYEGWVSTSEEYDKLVETEYDRARYLISLGFDEWLRLTGRVYKSYETFKEDLNN